MIAPTIALVANERFRAEGRPFGDVPAGFLVVEIHAQGERSLSRREGALRRDGAFQAERVFAWAQRVACAEPDGGGHPRASPVLAQVAGAEIQMDRSVRFAPERHRAVEFKALLAFAGTGSAEHRAAARAGVIVVVPGLGTLSTVANDIYMIMKIGSVYEEKITEKAAVSLLGSMGTVFAGGKLATLIPFAPLQIPLAIGMTYGLGRVVMEWIKAGKPKDLSAFKKVYEDASKYAKDNIDLFKKNPDKDKPLGDETKKFDV